MVYVINIDGQPLMPTNRHGNHLQYSYYIEARTIHSLLV